MRVLHAGIFVDHCLGGDIVLKAGFLANGLAHKEFDYRSIARQEGVATMNCRLAEEAKGIDLLFIGKGELIEVATLADVRRTGTQVAIWYGDIRPRPEPWLIRNLAECDAFFMSSAGDTLRQYYELGKPGRAAFFFNPCNPTLVDEHKDAPRSVAPPLYTGTMQDIQGPERKILYEHLCRRGDVQIVGSPARIIRSQLLRRVYLRLRPTKHLRGQAYIERIIGCRFGIGASARQDVKYYTSDRLSHYLTFGKLYLAWRFPDCEHLLQDGVHLVYFDSLDDLDTKMDFYLKRPELCEEIGARGQAKMLTEYNAANMIRMMLDIISTGHSSAFPWVEVYG